MKKIKVNLRKLNPEAAKMWCYELNGKLTPDTVAGRSDKEVYFRCLDNPKHLFTKRISKMTADDGRSVGCVYCGPNAKKAFPGETDFLTKCKEARDMWDYELNKNLNSNNIFFQSNKSAYFKCKKGHITYRKIKAFYKSPKCTTCEKEKTKIVYKFPNIRLFWDKNKNKDNILDKLIRSSRHIVYFKCPNCNYEWESQISLWNKRSYCPCCGFDGEQNSIELNRSIIEQNPITTFRKANPDDAKMWCYDLNGDMNPDNTLYGSGKKAYFECKNGHKFNKQIYEMTTIDGKPKGCPYCNGWINKAYPGENDFFTLCPIAKDMWDYDKNQEIIPKLLLTNSGKKVHFKCAKGHSFIKKIKKFYENPECPECVLIKKNSSLIEKQKLLIKKREDNSFRKYNPAASKLWVDNLNKGLTPDNVDKKSGKTIYMRCEKNAKHIFQIKVYYIPKKNPFYCPDCRENSKIPKLGVNDIFTICPDLEKMWDWEKNKGINPYHLFKTSETDIHLKCNKGHRFTRYVRNFVRNFNCPVCKQERNSISNYPQMVKQWDFSKNEKIDINIVSSRSTRDAWWKCRKCGYEWQSKISSRRASKGLCPCCDNRTVVVEGVTDLFTTVPDLKIDYDFKKNIGINTALLSRSSKEPIQWKCNVCGYEWIASPMGRVKRNKDNHYVSSCPACAGSVRTKTYAEEYPELIPKFIEEKNKCKLADLKGKDYNLNFWWNCNICREDFKSALSTMIRGKDSKTKGCSYCSGRKVKKENSFANIHKDLMDEYDPSNIIDPYNVTEHSDKSVKWICRNNSEHKWKTTFRSRAKGEGTCKDCRNWNYGKIFSEEHPEFKPFYDNERNKIPFNSYSYMSNKYAWWKCEKGHSFEWSIINFSTLGRFECPICTNKIFVRGENDLESQHPDLALEFDIEKNGITPDMISSSDNNDKIWWKCNEGHEIQRSIWYRVNQVRACPVCNRSIIIKGVNDFETAYPDVVKIWDYQKNSRGPDTISDRNKMKFSFKCHHGHQYETKLDTAINHNFECLLCTNKIVKEGINSLLDTHEELAKEFSPKEERKPYEFSKNYSYSIKWKCPTCNGEYRYPINKREIGDDSCPYCNNDRVLEGHNSLVDTDFELIKEWGPSNERGPETYLKMYTTWVSWLCPTCNGEYNYPINKREFGDDSCPYCNNDRALEGHNSLIDTDFELAKEWGPSNERGPETYLKMYTTWVSWLCPTCNGEYNYPINTREIGDDSCPYCNGTKLLHGYNSFKVKHSDLMEEWDHINNYILCNSEYILDTYSDKVWWICKDCNYKFFMSPKLRIYYQHRNMIACPHCKGLRQKKIYFF